MLQTMCILELKRESYAHLKQTGHRWKLSLKLASWIWNGFWPFKTHRNARKLLEEAKFESPYLFQAKGTYFEPEKHRVFAWAMGKFEIHCEFWTRLVDFELVQFSPSYEWILNSPKFRTQPLVIKFKPDYMLKQVPNVSIQFKIHCTYLKLVIFEVFLGCLWVFLVISG